MAARAGGRRHIFAGWRQQRFGLALQQTVFQDSWHVAMPSEGGVHSIGISSCRFHVLTWFGRTSCSAPIRLHAVALPQRSQRHRRLLNSGVLEGRQEALLTPVFNWRTLTTATARAKEAP